MVQKGGFCEWALRYCKPFAVLLQTVSSCRGPIYRARIYVNTHEMANGNVCVMKRKCIFGNGNMHFCLC